MYRAIKIVTTTSEIMVPPMINRLRNTALSFLIFLSCHYENSQSNSDWSVSIRLTTSITVAASAAASTAASLTFAASATSAIRAICTTFEALHTALKCHQMSLL